MVPRIGVMREVPNRHYATALKSGLHNGSTLGSSARSPQPALFQYDEETLKDATTNNELPKSPCSLYFQCAKSTFDLRSLLQDIKKIGTSLASVRCVQKVSKDAFNITFTTPDERRLSFKKSEYVSR